MPAVGWQTIHHVVALDKVGGPVHGEEGVTVTLTGVGQCAWKAYATTWTAHLQTSSGDRVSKTAETEVRSEGRPATFEVVFGFPHLHEVGPLAELRVEGTVTRRSGAYRGHGMWFTFSE